MIAELTSPLGRLLIEEPGGAISRILLPGRAATHPTVPIVSASSSPILQEACRQLGEYFAGKLTDFSIPLSPVGTPFMLCVWQELRNIPYGTTVSYKTIATAIGNPRAVRAVGMANGRNPIPIIIPCHRVIGTNGSLVGYSGGLPIKRQLLSLEAHELF